MFIGDALYEINTAIPAALCLALNSTLCRMVTNVVVRTNFGAGVLEVEVDEAANLAIVNPQLLP